METTPVIFKLIIVGDACTILSNGAAVGKSSIIRRLVKGFFNVEHEVTPNAELECKVFDFPHGQVCLHIWDTVFLRSLPCARLANRT